MSAPYRVRPLDGPLSATVEVPGSKSVANRALVCAALAEGRSVVRGVPDGDDTAAMVDGLAALGVAVAPAGEADLTVHGRGGAVIPGGTVQARLAGTTSRFLTALAALADGPVTVDGAPPLRARPMTPLHDALRDLGAGVEPNGPPGHLPVTIRGPLRRGGAIRLRGDVSSQYLSALMMIGPLLPGGLRLELTTALVSRPYVGITAAVMAAFGVEGVAVGHDAVVVPEGAYRPTDYGVEPDASSAGYPLAAAAVAGGTVHVPGLTDASLQGDARFGEVLADMGCEVAVGAAGTTVTREGPLRGVRVDMVDMSDLVPTLAVVAPFALGPTTITGVGFVRSKESDRIGDLCAELRRAGVGATEHADGLTVAPGPPGPARFDTHHDHRLAMGLALFGLVVDGVEIADPDVVAKSWPGYWRMLESLG